jgi:hypothetical protein
MKDLKFNNEKVVFTYQNDDYYVAVKPLCKALNIDFGNQFEVIKRDSILGAEYGNYRIQLGIQKRKFLCLPEKLIYGWLIQVNSSDPEFQKFKVECHKVLSEYFKGSIIGRKELIAQKANLINENQKSEIKLLSNLDFIKWKENIKKIDKVNSLLRTQDKNVMKDSLSLFD